MDSRVYYLLQDLKLNSDKKGNTRCYECLAQGNTCDAYPNIVDHIILENIPSTYIPAEDGVTDKVKYLKQRYYYSTCALMKHRYVDSGYGLSTQSIIMDCQSAQLCIIANILRKEIKENMK